MRKRRCPFLFFLSRQYAAAGGAIALVLAVYLYGSRAVAQTPHVPCNEITGDMGFTVRSVRVVGRWVPNELLERLTQIVRVGQPFSPTLLGPAQEAVRTELVRSETLSLPVLGATSALFITLDVCDVSDADHPKVVDITIHPYYLRVDLINVGNNTLPVPRTAAATFLTNVPALLLLTAPVIRVGNDRRYGFSLGLQTQTDLLRLADQRTARAAKLYLGIGVRYALNDPFYNINAGLRYTRPPIRENQLGWSVSGQYAKGLQPLGTGFYKLDRFNAQADLQSRRQAGLLTAYTLGGGVRWMQNRFAEGSSEASNTETGWEVHALGQGNPLKGTARLGLWFDAGYPDPGNNSYQRLAGRAGYAIELGQGHQNIGVTVNLGVGHAWGAVPAYSRFFAGNTNVDYLYETLSSPALKQFPTGPVLRSFGEQETGLAYAADRVNGGTGFWNLGLNLSFPVKRWSRPLVPDIAVDERSNLSRKLKGAAELAAAGITTYLIDVEGRPDNDDTEAETEKIMNRDVRPVIRYLADRANVYAIKPMLLVDVAHLSDRDINRQTWLGAGVGVQLTVVNARFEAGYLHTIAGTNTNTGNVFLRLNIQNFY